MLIQIAMHSMSTADVYFRKPSVWVDSVNGCTSNAASLREKNASLGD